MHPGYPHTTKPTAVVIVICEVEKTSLIGLYCLLGFSHRGGTHLHAAAAPLVCCVGVWQSCAVVHCISVLYISFGSAAQGEQRRDLVMRSEWCAVSVQRM